MMTTQDKFEHARGLEKQIQDLKIALQNALQRAGKSEDLVMRQQTDHLCAEKEIELLRKSRDEWRDKACDLQCK
jgi:hypothetical protein